MSPARHDEKVPALREGDVLICGACGACWGEPHDVDGRCSAFLLPGFHGARSEGADFELSPRPQQKVYFGHAPADRRPRFDEAGRPYHTEIGLTELPTTVRCPNPLCRRVNIVVGEQLEIEPYIGELLETEPDTGEPFDTEPYSGGMVQTATVATTHLRRIETRE